MKKLKFAIIGCGRISYKHIEGLAKNFEEAELVAVCDIVIERANKRSEEYYNLCGIEPLVYNDYRKMLDEVPIDAIAITTESGYHSEISIYCLNLGKHVLVEKPMALSTADAKNMIAAAEQNKVKLAVCHQNRFNLPIKQLREAIDKGRFGKLINGTARILWSRNMGYYKQAPWRGTWEQDGGTLMNQCIHNIDLLQWMMGGEIDTIYAQTGNYIRSIDAEDFGAIIIRFKNKAIGIVEGTACVYPKNLEETLSIFGETGTVCIGGLAVNKIETWQFADELEDEAALTSFKDDDPDTVYGFGHIPLYKDFIDAIIMNKQPLISGKEGIKAMQIILAAYKSQKTGMPIKYEGLEFSTIEMKNSDIR